MAVRGKRLGYDPLKDNPDFHCTGKVLGSGSFGDVVEAWGKKVGTDSAHVTDGAKERYAIKLLKRGDSITKNVKAEVLQHSKMWHPIVVQMSKVFLTQRHLCIVMELVEGGDLFNFVSRNDGCTEDQARWIFQQLILGVHYIHSIGVCQRDLKLENILVDNSSKQYPMIKITDFGYCKSSVDSAPHSCAGTPAYMAPEVYQTMGIEKQVYDGYKVDIWSCGILLYVMLYVRYPFDVPEDNADSGRKHREVLNRLMKGAQAVDFSSPKRKVSASCIDLIKKLLDPNPVTRPGAAVVLQHPWVTEGLPETAMQTNADCTRETLRRTDLSGQTTDAIRSLIEEARRRPRPT